MPWTGMERRWDGRLIDLSDGKGSDLYERIAQNIQRPASMVRLVAKLTDN